MTLGRLVRILRLRWRSLWEGGAVDRELDEELQYHVDRLAETYVARGMTPDDARTAALREMGGVEQRKEACRDERRLAPVEHVVRDIGLALRQLRAQPGFATAAIASLALGIGANTAMLQLLDALAFRPLPVAAPHELVEVRLEGRGRAGRHTGRNRQWSQAQWFALQERRDPFRSMLAFGDTRFNLATSGEVRYVEGLWVSGSFFDALGVAPVVGRLIGPEDDRPGCPAPGAVIGHALWQREFGGRRDILEQTIPFGASRVPIVGVTPPVFFGAEVGRRFEVALPLCAAGFDRRDHWWLAVVGRLRPGWTAAQAHAYLQLQLPAIQDETMPPTFDAGLAATYRAMWPTVVDARSGVSPLRTTFRRPLWTLTAIAALVLLIGSVNLANLLLARAAAREQEFAVRLAIGGSRGRVFQQVLTESLVLAALGATVAIAVALAVSRSLVGLMSTTVDPIYLDMSPDWRMLLTTALVACSTAVMFGLVPAFRSARATALTPGPRTGTTRASLGTRRRLVTAQLAFTVVLLFGALLFLRSFANLATMDLGVRTDGVVVANVFFPAATFPPERRAVAYPELERRLAALPGVARVAEAFTTPIGGSFSDRQVMIGGQPKGESYVNWIGPGYFDVLSTPLVAGRDVDARDTAGSPRVAVVNEAFAAQFLRPNPVGERFSADQVGGAAVEYEVIGVVRNQKYMGLREPFPPIYYPASSQEAPGLTRRYVIRSTAAPAGTMAATIAVLRELDPAITVRHALLETQVGDALLQDRLTALLAALFGAVALLLALLGLYGVVAYGVACRRAEIGLRLALGATRSAVLRTMLGDVARMLAVGSVVGGLTALLVGRTSGSLLYELEPSDPATLIAAIAVLVGAGLAAAAWPSWRAAGTDPSSALRCE